MEKRNKLEIIRDILTLLQDNHKPMKPTPLMRKSNLPTSRFKKYLDILMKKGFIIEIGGNNEKEINVTNKGLRFIEKYKTIVDFIEEFEL